MSWARYLRGTLGLVWLLRWDTRVSDHILLKKKKKLMQVEGLSHQEHLSAYVKMISDESMMIRFFTLPQEGKTDVVRHIIS